MNCDEQVAVEKEIVHLYEKEQKSKINPQTQKLVDRLLAEIVRFHKEFAKFDKSFPQKIKLLSNGEQAISHNGRNFNLRQLRQRYEDLQRVKNKQSAPPAQSSASGVHSAARRPPTVNEDDLLLAGLTSKTSV